MVDGILLDAVAADAIRPPGLRAGVAGLTATATGTPQEKMAADIRQLLAGIAPALKPVLIASTAQVTAVSTLGLALPTIRAPFLTAGTAIMIDATAFASILGPLDTMATEEAHFHESDVPLALAGGVAQPPLLASVAAPARSLFQTAALALRSLLDINWGLRRSGSVAWISGAGW